MVFPSDFVVTFDHHLTSKVVQNQIITCFTFLEEQSLWPMLIFYQTISVGWKLVWPKYILTMRNSVGSRKLLWPTTIGLFHAPSRIFPSTWLLRQYYYVVFATTKYILNGGNGVKCNQRHVAPPFTFKNFTTSHLNVMPLASKKLSFHMVAPPMLLCCVCNHYLHIWMSSSFVEYLPTFTNDL